MSTPTRLSILFSEKLPDDLQKKVLTTFLRIVIPVFWLTAVISHLAIFLFAPHQLFRLIPGGVGALILLVCTILFVRNRVKAAAWLLFLACGLVVLLGLILSGGVHALVYYGLIGIGVISAALFGNRVGVIFVFSSVVVSFVFVLLEYQGGIEVPPEQGGLLRAVIALAWLMIAMVAIMVPISMMNNALRQSEIERKNAMMQTLRAEASFHQSFQFMGLLQPDGTLLTANHTALAFIDRSDHEVMGMPFEETPWWPKTERARLRKAIESARNGERVSFETWHRNREGDRRIIDFTIGPFRDEHGAIVYLIVEGSDVTELVTAKEMLSQREKMDSIGELAGGIAHDFNNMLGGIIGAAEMLNLEDEKSEQFIRTMNILMTSAERASALTDKLLVFSRRKSGEREYVAFHHLIDETVSLLSHTIDKRIKIETSLDAASDSVFVDAAQMQNVLLNLGINARDAMPNGGTLRISTRNVTIDEPSRRVGSFELIPGQYLKVSVSDNGVGMDRAVQKRVFEPFFTTKGPGKGTGLGLATTYGTLSAHQGAVHLYSEPGQGTVFHLFIPLQQGSDASQRETPVPDFVDEGTVLVIDDETVVIETTEMMLRSLGYSVLQAQDGATGAAMFEQHCREIKLVVLDMIMPRMNGVDVFRRIRQVQPDAVIILVSGFAPDDAVRKLKQEGLNGFLEKPFHRKDLIRALEKALR